MGQGMPLGQEASSQEVAPLQAVAQHTHSSAEERRLPTTAPSTGAAAWQIPVQLTREAVATQAEQSLTHGVPQ
jgi:hypothetical protein